MLDDGTFLDRQPYGDGRKLSCVGALSFFDGLKYLVIPVDIFALSQSTVPHGITHDHERKFS